MINWYFCAMAVKNLREFIDILEEHGELIRIKEYVNPYLEIAEITDRVSKSPNQNKALLFENTGTDYPVLINMMGSEKRMALALGVEEIDDARKDIENLFKDLMTPRSGIINQLQMLPKLSQLANWMPKIVSQSKATCQEIVLNEPDIKRLPVLTCWPADGGPFLTLPVVHTKHPVDGTRNVGLYRVQVFDKNLTGMHWHKHKVSAGHYNEYKKLGKKMPVAIVLGGDPLYSYAATAPLPPNVDEYILAGFLRKKKVELVPCISQPEIHVPADADFVIEGYVDPEEDLILEGPFGDHTGYYSLADFYPKFHITAITHRKDAVYPATIVGIPPQEDAWIGKATERIFLAPIKMTLVPEIVDMNLPIEGVFHNLTLVKIKKEYAGQGQKVMNAMWGAGQMMFNKILVIVDEDVDLSDYKSVAQLFSKHVDPKQDIIIGTGPMDVLDHSCSAFAFGGKMGIDATRKFPEELRNQNQREENLDDLSSQITLERLRKEDPQIKQVFTGLLDLGISIVCIAIDKNKPNHVQSLSEKLFHLPSFQSVKMVLFVDDLFHKLTDIADIVWYVSNNMDAKRDSYFYDSIDPDGSSHIAIDGCRKTKQFDNFDREWPNVITANSVTIARVDKKWRNLGLGSFIPSPSLKYKELSYGEGAVAD